MGKGDRKTRRGKIWRGTYGKTRRPNKLKRAHKNAKTATKVEGDN